MAAARARGRKGGRPKKLDTPTKVAMAKALYADHSHSIADICKSLGIARHALSLPRFPGDKAAGNPDATDSK
jgi:DNA invertase Pin-like site-specific DNA recombinase